MYIRQFIVFFAIMCLPQVLFASWEGPKNILEGAWGKATGEFGIFHGDSFDYFPKDILVDRKNRILVLDIINKRLQICESNKCLALTPQSLPKGSEGRSWPYKGKLAIVDDTIIETRHDQIYDFQGNLIGQYDVGNKYFRGQDFDENLYFEDDVSDRYYKYSPTGELLATYDKKPLALGVKTSERKAGDTYQTTIQYEDITYSLTSDEPIEDYVRDHSDNLHATFHYYLDKQHNIWTNRVIKYDPCGKALGHWDKPFGSLQEIPTDPDAPPPPTAQIEILEEYGPPVIGPDGSIYAWKRTPNTYSILKWTWVDSPDDPKPGPDAPANLKVVSSLDGLYLTWDASPQDPGCVGGYEIERSTSAGGIYTPVTTTDPGVLKYNDTSALPGTTYFYKVRAKGGGEYSPYTAEVSGKRIQ